MAMVVGADAGTAHHFESVGSLEHLFRDLRAAADNQCVCFGNSLEQLLGRQPGLIVKHDTFCLFQDMKAFSGEFVRNQYSHDMGPWRLERGVVQKS
jgi:hypothetical protein